MNEMGCRDWCHAEKQILFVACSCEHDDIPLPVAQCEKRITLVATISMEGSLPGQMIIIPRKTIEINHFPGRLMGPELINLF
jgi:hypothetical protein